MKFPSANKEPKRRITISKLSGGLNLRDTPSHCNDDQLTSGMNVWYKEGSLRTRPGLETSERMSAVLPKGDGEAVIKSFHEILYEKSTDAGLQVFMLQAVGIPVSGTSDTQGFSIFFFWQGKEETLTIPEINIAAVNESLNFFVAESNGVLYCYVSNRKVFSLNYLEADCLWHEVTDDEMYLPTVAVDCRVDGNMRMKPEAVAASGTPTEGLNILASRYRLLYTAYNPDVAFLSEESGINKMVHYMQYSLLDNMAQEKYSGKPIDVVFTKNGAGIKHSVTPKGKYEWYFEEDFRSDGLKMGICGNMLWFYTLGADGAQKVATISESNPAKNNLEIIAPYIFEDSAKQKLFDMTRAVQFGGTEAGLAGGRRLFLCGNSGKTYDEDKALIMWSGLNNPLYFPENAFFYVGNTTERVTGFGKQADMLVIFKANEVWYTKHQKNVTSKTEQYSDVYDVFSSNKCFPLTQIHQSIGCGYPETVQLCRNRLVFMGNDRRIYTLISESNYNERNIFCVSEMIDREVRSITYGQINACDWEGFYCLEVGGGVYLMDYNSYGFQYIASYSKYNDANLKIPWYYWKLPTSGKLFTVDDAMLFSHCVTASDGENRLISYAMSRESGSSDTLAVIADSGEAEFKKQRISCAVQTKLFDFSAPNSFKNISAVGLSLGYNGGDEITVTFITDGGEEQTAVILEDAAEERSVGFIRSVILSPAIRAAVRFGIRLECKGKLITDGFSVSYRATGKAR
ncbi:MAG: hypothetical protein IKD04_02060 [Clostridia bacterium]|nr:hypothetical protein [Clostridia bacterium]